MRNYQDQFVKQGTVAAGDTVYIQSESGYRNHYTETEVVRTTKTLVVVKTYTWAAGVKVEGTTSYRYSPARNLYSNKSTYSETVLVIPEVAEESFAADVKEKEINSLRSQAIGVADTLNERRRWMTSRDVVAAAEKLTALAAQLDLIEGN